jgi:hypothetical protein
VLYRYCVRMLLGLLLTIIPSTDNNAHASLRNRTHRLKMRWVYCGLRCIKFSFLQLHNNHERSGACKVGDIFLIDLAILSRLELSTYGKVVLNKMPD